MEQWGRVCIPGTWSFFQTWSYLFSFLILEEVLSLVSVENARENYFYVAKHPVPSEGGRRENLTILSPFLTLCSLQTWIACAVYLNFLCNLSSSFFCENTHLKTMVETHKNTTLEKPFWSEQSPSSELLGSDLVKKILSITNNIL